MMGRQDLIYTIKYTTASLYFDWLSVFSVALVQSIIYTYMYICTVHVLVSL